MSLRRCTCTQFDNEDPSIKHPSERQIFKHYVNHGPIQPSGGFIRNDEGRSFRAEWFNRFPWLEFSLLKQSAFCFYCRLFAIEGSSTGRGGNVEAAFTSIGKLNRACFYIQSRWAKPHPLCQIAYPLPAILPKWSNHFGSVNVNVS